jgi:hypothetical protein
MMPRRDGHRVVQSIISARRLSARPACIPIGRPRGIKRAGIAYQRAFEAALLKQFPRHGVMIGPWFEYHDATGRHFCQPDALIYDIECDTFCIIEVKLSDFALAERQITQLYAPVLRASGILFPGALVVVKNLSPEASERPVFDDFRRALVASRAPGVIGVLHWLGRGPIAGPPLRLRPTFGALSAS